jgi:hypothetical protein
MFQGFNVSRFQCLNLYGAKVIFFSVNSKFSAQIVIFLRIKQVILRGGEEEILPTQRMLNVNTLEKMQSGQLNYFQRYTSKHLI